MLNCYSTNPDTLKSISKKDNKKIGDKKMKRQYILGLVSGIAISSVLVVNAAQTHTTIESCAQLLPHGETYELTIKGTIETNEQEPLFTGNMNLTAGAEGDVPDIQREEVTPFANCVKSFLK
tara:strand:- start:29 stop:394 length:366 start_codon:yes stop_codon:yes gene_type:complete